MLFSRIQLPPLIGYLTAGAVLGAYGYEAGASAVCLPITQAGEKLADLSLSDDDSHSNMIIETI